MFLPAAEASKDTCLKVLTAKTAAPCILLLFLFVVSAGVAGAAPAPKLWPSWQANNQDSQVSSDHTAWDTLLHGYVDAGHPSGINRFGYSRVTPEGHRL